jgi:hypothetical protein
MLRVMNIAIAAHFVDGRQPAAVAPADGFIRNQFRRWNTAARNSSMLGRR